MNAVDFIKKYTIDKARKVVEGAPDGATSIIGEKYCRFTDKEYWYWSFSGCKNKGKSEQYFYYKKRTTDLSELKRLVESVDFINKFGGIALAKAYDKEIGSHGFDPFFERAITNYEAIYGVNRD